MAASSSFPEWATSHREVTAWRTHVYQQGIEDGLYQPFVLPFFFVGTGIVLLYMVVPSLKGPFARYGIFGLNVAFQSWIIKTCRSGNASAGLIIGMLSSWSIFWSAVLLLLKDARGRFKKVQRVQFKAMNGSVANGHAVNGSATSTTKTNSARTERYQWQTLPNNLLQRIGWAADLLFNFRGVGWDWKVSGMPSRPPNIEAQLLGIDVEQATKDDRPRTSGGRFRFDSRTQVVIHHAKLVIGGFLLLDVLKTIINHDPYFWGLIDRAPPPYFPQVLLSSNVLITAYRNTLVVAYIFLSLQSAFAMVPLIFVALPKSVAGCNGEPWMYPDQFGAYSTTFTRGLAGFWGAWWHMIFRYGFQTAGRWLTQDALRLKPRSQIGGVLELTASFALSGFLHAAASTTMIGDTRPWTKMFLFFILQPTGIIVEIIVAYLIGRSSIGRRMPAWLGWLGHGIYAHTWLYFTVPLLADELVRGGLLLSEPTPFSLIRALGYGVPGDGAFCWDNLLTEWLWDSKRWWLRGLAI